MKKVLMVFVLVFVLARFGWSADYILASNPDGRIGSFIWTIGGSFGAGSYDERTSKLLVQSYDLNAYSFLCKLEHPASKNLTFIFQVDYLHEKVGISGIHEGITSMYRAGMYFKFFSK